MLSLQLLQLRLRQLQLLPERRARFIAQLNLNRNRRRCVNASNGTDGFGHFVNCIDHARWKQFRTWLIRRRLLNMRQWRKTAQRRPRIELTTQLKHFVDERMLGLPALLMFLQSICQLGKAVNNFSHTLCMDDADGLLSQQDVALRTKQAHLALNCLHLHGSSVLCERHPRTGGVQQTHRLVRQLARRNVAVRQLHRSLNRPIKNQHLVV